MVATLPLKALGLTLFLLVCSPALRASFLQEEPCALEGQTPSSRSESAVEIPHPSSEETLSSEEKLKKKGISPTLNLKAVRFWGLSTEAVEYLFSQSTDLVCIVEATEQFRRLSGAWLKRLGWALEEMVDVPYSHFLHPKDRPKITPSALFHEHAPFGCHESLVRGITARWQCKDGSYRWLDLRGMPQEPTTDTASAANVLFLALACDVTAERQRAKDAKQKLKVATQSLDSKAKLLEAINDVQTAYINSRPYAQAEMPYHYLVKALNHLICLSESKVGFLGELLPDQEGGIVLSQQPERKFRLYQIFGCHPSVPQAVQDTLMQAHRPLMQKCRFGASTRR